MTLTVTRDQAVATITMDNPPVNALTLERYREIGDVFEDTAAWSDIHCIILTGAGSKAFCAGLDLNEFVAATVEQDPNRAAVIRRAFAAIRKASVPVIAAINGPALGAGNVIASCADFRICTPNSRFGMPEVNIGRCGGAAHMARHLPQGLLRRMYFTGLPISAEEAARWGYVEEIVAAEDLMPRAREFATLIASKAPLGLRLAKEALNRIEFMPTEEGYELEQSYSTRLMTTADAREAIRATVEKRAPVWTGR